jgi:hypothetical protein
MIVTRRNTMKDLIRDVTSAENKSIYLMSRDETRADIKYCKQMIAWGFTIGLGGFTLLWFAVAFALPLVFPIQPNIPIILEINEPVILLDEEEIIGTPITIPSEPDDEEWVLIKKRVQ